MIPLSRYIRKIAESSQGQYWAGKITNEYGIKIAPTYDPLIIRQIYNALRDIPTALVKDCKISEFYVKDLGESKSYYPNHGYFLPSDRSITMNCNIYYHPDDFEDDLGYHLLRPRQTLFHEFSHAADSAFGDLSLKPEWLSLSGWSREYKPGLKRLIIKEPGTPEVIGEWFYNPIIAGPQGFTRFYAKRNPWDDWADSGCFWLGGLREKVPITKRKYFDNLLGKYYK